MPKGLLIGQLKPIQRACLSTNYIFLPISISTSLVVSNLSFIKLFLQSCNVKNYFRELLACKKYELKI